MKAPVILFLLSVSITVQSYSVNSSALYGDVYESLDSNNSSLGTVEPSTNGTELLRSKRAPILPLIGAIAGLTGTVAGGVSIGKAAEGERCRDSGCHKGYCWAWCGITHDHGEWCYTTKRHSQSYKYVKCSSDSDCNGCWHCAGPCTL